MHNVQFQESFERSQRSEEVKWAELCSGLVFHNKERKQMKNSKMAGLRNLALIYIIRGTKASITQVNFRIVDRF